MLKVEKKMMVKILLTIALVFCMVVPPAYCSDSSDPAPAKGTIIYVDIPEPGRTYLGSIDTDGENKKRLTPEFNNIIFPRYNDAAGWIGFTNQTKDMQSEIYLLNRTRDRVRRVLTGAALEDFSPDGKFLLYTGFDGKGELFVYSIERQQASKISQDLRVTSASWSPCGDWIAASVLTSHGTTDLYVISTMAMGIKRITNTPDVNEAFPVFSKDSKYLIYFTDKYGEHEIEYIEIETQETQRPVISGAFPSLSSDNSWLVYQYGNALYLSSIEGLYEQRLTTHAQYPVWIK